ncbi:MAG: DUF2249 domain-containing protein [Paludibacterium sp.]|uniref:DUF2249 domain-containing protein n=1 Tax=Paludibacterium sp. TaxID=1917523 RepID=UPI0025F7D7DE|nr:DUF2249 domain-containing protein [Paludibacterium sp.]MBV8049149.1 DUF2249 domain-containing protein [Paludibacterium sp.]MBV8648827.1 DUF2249 domain-containing protein [Paludibacterium sp.]
MSAQDLRHLVPPQPMEIILEAAETLEPGQTLSYVLPHHPLPLYPLLEQQGIRYRCELSDDGGVILHIELA